VANSRKDSFQIVTPRRNRGVIPSLIAFLLVGSFAPLACAQDKQVITIVSEQGSKQYFTSKSAMAMQYTGPGLGAVDACDLNADGRVDVTDVQLGVNQGLKIAACTDADLHLNNTCTVLDVQVIVTDVETGTCLVPDCKSPLTYPNSDQFPSVAPACPPSLPANPNPVGWTGQDDGPIHPCMYVHDGVRFQAILVTGVSGSESLNADLYEGTTCDPNKLVDQVFGGEQVPFWGTSLYWLTHFWDQPGTSAVWTVGNTTTPCIDYSKAPDCD